MLNRARKLLNRGRTESGFSFERPLVLIQSDDWGRAGVRDREGFEELRAGGLPLGQHAYDFYSLETAEDVIAVREMLLHHHDSSGRPPCMVMNFLTANLDFPKIVASDFRKIELLALSRGLPGRWKRPGLVEAYRQGIGDGVFYPALHGMTHCCQAALECALAESGERRELLRQLWKAEASYIYWRMPWIGYEYWNPEKPKAGFLLPETQENLIRLAAEGFAKLFSVFPESACAPGYRSNPDTHAAWHKWGLRVAQNGSGAPVLPFIDEFEVLNISRTIDLEPSQKDLPLEKYMQLAEGCISKGMPVVVSVHSINFHSSLRDFRGPTLSALDQLLSALEARYPDLLYVHDGDLYRIVTRGKFTSKTGSMTVTAKQSGGTARSASWGAK
ncbi:MAG TPA: hypothetical protein VJQ82_25080 [Terriglobales bacterium]|nr:hypothetical protein [Terriglobales bacterium]